MVAAVRPFSVEYKDSWYQVFYIYEQITSGVTHLGYCAAGPNSEPLFIPADKVTKIRADV